MQRVGLYPKTANHPIQLSDYFVSAQRDVVVDRERMTDEFVQWVERKAKRDARRYNRAKREAK